MESFDLLMIRLQLLLRDTVSVEDNRIYISRKAGYEIFNLMEELDKGFINELLKEKGFVNNNE
jgi:stage III sporulation protein SpoIIIAA